MEVNLINKKEVKSLFKNWGEFAVKCYNTPKEKAEAVGKHCMKSGHYSGSRCENFKFDIDGISRACSMQVNRHGAGVNINQQSQRYVSMDNFKYVTPPSIEAIPEALAEYVEAMEYLRSKYTVIQRLLIDNGRTQEQANEDARYVLPESTCTTGVWSFNLEALEHFSHKRICSRAQWEIKRLAVAMRKQVIQEMPELKDKLVPHCKHLMWCPEGKSCCGMMPTKEMLKEKMNG